jgi:hypothetical protein
MSRFFSFLVLFFTFFSCFTSTTSKPEKIVDEIVCKRIGESGTSVVFASDAWLPNPLGALPSLEEKIVKMLWLAHGSDMGIKISSNESSHEYAEEHFDRLQQERGITRDDLVAACKKAGFTLDDVKRELNDQYLLQTCIETTIVASESIQPTEKEIEDYYNSNPEIIPERYVIQKGVYKGNASVIYNKNYVDSDVCWEEPYEVDPDSLSEKFSHISKVNNGDVVTVIEKEGEVHVYKLVSYAASHKLSLENVYEKIKMILQQKKYMEAYKRLTIEFLNSDNVIFTNQEYKDRCIGFVKNIQ